MKKVWTEDSINYLKLNYKLFDRDTLANNLDVSIRGLEVKMSRLGLSLNDFKWETIFCLHCNKEVKCLKKEKRKYCSHSCTALFTNPIRSYSYLTPEYKKKLSINAVNRAKERGYKRVRKTCKVCGNTCKKLENIYCSTECRSNCSELKDKASTRMKQRFIDNPELHPNRLCAGIKESYPEKMLTDYLNQQGLIKEVDYIKQFKLGTYYIDFVFPTLELAVEVDGSYWHNSNSEREIKRHKFIEQEYRLIRFEAKKLVKKEYQEEIDRIILEILNQK